MPQLLSVLVPLYNEAEYIHALLERVAAVPLPEGLDREIIVVDDASRDESVQQVRLFQSSNPGLVKLVQHPENRGKGAAIQTAIAEASGDFCLIQDADLEYDPADYPRLLRPLLADRADAVYGSRFVTGEERRVLYFWHALANHFLTTACNIVADLNLTDMETCYKAIRAPLLKSIPLRSRRFGFEPEITIKLAKRKARIYEVPISYHGRTYHEGKKIGIKDAIEALYLIVRFAFSQDVYRDNEEQILHAFSSAHNFNQWMADTIRPFIGKEVIEIGAGMGNLTRQLAPGRKRYIATDLRREHLSRLMASFHHQPNLIACTCDLENPADFAPYAGRLDTVVCLNVLEHVADDLTGLRNMYTLLRPGGRAIVLVPHGMDAYGTLDKALGHFRRYSREELSSKMKNVGFNVEAVLNFNRISRPGWILTGRILHRKSINIQQLRVFDSLVWLWRRCDHLLPWASTSIIAVGVKP